MNNRTKLVALSMFIGFVAGVVWLVAVRFVTYQSDAVHHHANFALYINGEREPFDSFTFYEEVQSCSSDELNNPRTRVHLHDNVNHVIHVHDDAVTWEHFFANLGYALTNKSVQTDEGVFLDGVDDNELTFILNGEPVTTVANRLISSEDTLLVSYGQDDAEELSARYDAINKDAAVYNEQNDPSSCSGGQALTFGERLKQAIGIL